MKIIRIFFYFALVPAISCQSANFEFARDLECTLVPLTRNALQIKYIHHFPKTDYWTLVNLNRNRSEQALLFDSLSFDKPLSLPWLKPMQEIELLKVNRSSGIEFIVRNQNLNGSWSLGKHTFSGGLEGQSPLLPADEKLARVITIHDLTYVITVRKDLPKWAVSSLSESEGKLAMTQLQEHSGEFKILDDFGIIWIEPLGSSKGIGAMLYSWTPNSVQVLAKLDFFPADIWDIRQDGQALVVYRQLGNALDGDASLQRIRIDKALEPPTALSLGDLDLVELRYIKGPRPKLIAQLLAGQKSQLALIEDRDGKLKVTKKWGPLPSGVHLISVFEGKADEPAAIFKRQENLAARHYVCPLTWR